LKGKQYLKSGEKYYISDIGLRNYLLKKVGVDFGFILENLVYLELRRRGYSVAVGKILDKEVDFVATSPDLKVEYYQISYTITDEATLMREKTSLLQIKDNHPKCILHMDNVPNSNQDGIIIQNALNWLLD
jgi:predicted AAA+ superfamily ATPase